MTAETGGKMLARPLILFITVLRNENELPGTKVPIFVTNSGVIKTLAAMFVPSSYQITGV